MPYPQADKLRTDSIHIYTRYSSTMEEKLEAFDNYLKSEFSLEVERCDYKVDKLDYEQFCKIEVGTMQADDHISQEFLDAIIDKYGVDRDFISGNEQLLARISNNDMIMRLLRYIEHLSDQQLETIEIQIKALAEENKKGSD